MANQNNADVTVYTAGTTSLLRTISQGVSGPRALAFDGSGNLYVTNQGGNTVTAYAPGSGTVMRTLRKDMSSPDALAFAP